MVRLLYIAIAICMIIYGYVVYEKEQQKDNNNRDISLLWTGGAFICLGILWGFQTFLMSLTSPDRDHSFLRFLFARDLFKLALSFIK